MTTFPILFQGHWKDYRDRFPASVPRGLVEEHRRQAAVNHYQDLDTLARRGGLAPCELLAVLENRRWFAVSAEEALARLQQLVNDYQRRNP